MKKAAAYMRMSTDKQEYSIDSQWRLIQAYAERNGYTVVQKYTDEGISGRAAEKRPAFMRMMDDSDLGEWEAVLIYDSSRFARNLKDSIVYKSLLQQNGVALISITEPTLDEDSSLITDALFGAMNEMYSRKLSKNVKRGLEQKVLRGEVPSKPPFGYRRDSPSAPFEIVPEEAALVAYIHEQFQAGRSAYNLALEIARLPVRTRQGHPFDTRQIQRILTGAVYKGWMDVHIGENHYLQKAPQAPIVSEETYNATQAIFQERQAKRPPKQKPHEQHSHWLSGKIRCGSCGCAYVRRTNQPNHSPSFRCCNYSRGICRSNPSITQPNLERIFMEMAEAFLINTDVYNVSAVAVPHSRPDADFEGMLFRLEKSLRRAKDAYLAEIDTLAEYRANKQRIEGEIAAVKNQQQEAAAPTIDLAKVQKDVRGLLNVLQDPSSSLEEKQILVERTIERVTINQDRSVSIAFFYSYEGL